MHVALIGDFPRELERPAGGVEAVVGCLAQALVRRGVELSLLHYGGDAGERLHPELGCRWIGLPRLRPAGLTFSTITPFSVRRILAGLEPDVVHVQGLPELCRDVSRPSVLTVHGMPHEDARYRGGPASAFAPLLRERSFRRALRRYTRLIAISPYVRRALGSDVPPSRAVPNPVDDRFFDVVRRPVPNSLLCVGALSRLKNTRLLVEVAARLRERFPDLRYRMAGAWDPDYRPEVLAAIERHSLGGHFEFLGSLDRTALSKELASCTGLVLPSLQENAPMAIQEAMAAGVPVAASAVGGVPDLLASGERGVLFDPTDLQAATRELARFVDDPALRERTSSVARRHAEQTLRADAVAEATCAVYAEARAAFAGGAGA